MPDKLIRCIDCEKEFIFTAGEQDFILPEDLGFQGDANLVGIVESKVQYYEPFL